MRWLLRILLPLAALAIMLRSVLPVFGAVSDVVTVTARPNIGGYYVYSLTLTDLGSSTAQADWTVSSNTTYTMLRISRDIAPDTVTDGELAYYGPSTSFNLTGLNLDYTTYYVSAFAFSSDNSTHGEPLSASVGGEVMIYLVLTFIPVALTVAMFVTRMAMLGFPCGIFWAVLGGYCYSQFTTPWVDWQFYVMFASLAGMLPFTILAAFGLREKRDTIGEVQMEHGDGGYIDEKSHNIKPEIEENEMIDEGAEYEPGSYAKDMRKRMAKRRGRKKSGGIYL